jgi:hypothetical protein
VSRLDVLAHAELTEALRVHYESWPEPRVALTELLGSTVSEVMDGTCWSFIPEGHDLRLVIPNLTPSDEAALAELMPPFVDRAGFASWPCDAAQLVDTQQDTIWGVANYSLPSPALAFAKKLVSPLFGKLMGPWRLRTSPGPKTLKARLALIDLSIDAHETLGLDPSPILRMLDPALDADGFFEVRCELRDSWAARPEDFPQRVAFFLAREIARQAAKKQKKDGTVAESDILKGRLSEPALALLGSWENITLYLGLEKVRNRAVAPPVPIPEETPDAIRNRVDLMRSWWEYADELWASQPFGDPALFGVVPDREVPSYRLVEGASREESLPAQFERQDELELYWGRRSGKPNPTLLIPEREPEAALVESLGAPFRFWHEVGLTLYFLVHGPYARCSLDDIDEYYGYWTKQLSDIGAPIDPGLWSDLREAARHDDQGFHPQGISIWIDASGLADDLKEDGADQESIEFFEAQAKLEEEQMAERLLQRSNSFHAMRDVLTRHRRKWFSSYWEDWAASQWRDDLTVAGTACLEAVLNREGKPLTAKQAWPILGPVANRWFGGNCSQVARLVGVDGPIADRPDDFIRPMPDDLETLMRSVSNELGGEPDSRDWSVRRIGEIAGRTPEALEHWQATGKAPSVNALSIRSLVEEAWPNDPNAGFSLFLRTIGEKLVTTGHPAADVFLAAGE